ncbi:hypothetical protein MNV49_007927 [Pseudohyphozyma bogoriensis]|nr:hypothetical protein MNV49_007925 [Pseudohyphozyma bogoriensis]KAI5476290.1 hypothetical protein MNV49_007927 [Pseudohyphozyma bogoriensis]
MSTTARPSLPRYDAAPPLVTIAPAVPSRARIPPMVTVSAPLTHTSSWSLAYLDLALPPQTLVGGPETLPPSAYYVGGRRDETPQWVWRSMVEQREAIAMFARNIAHSSTSTFMSTPLLTEQKHILFFCAIILWLVEGVVTSFLVRVHLRERGSMMNPFLLSRVLRREHDEMIYAYFKNDWAFAEDHPNRPYFDALYHGALPACLVEANFAASLWMNAPPSRADLVLARLQEPFSLSQLPQDPFPSSASKSERSLLREKKKLTIDGFEQLGLRKNGRSLFKCVGVGGMDVAITGLVVEMAKSMGVGTAVPY